MRPTSLLSVFLSGVYKKQSHEHVPESLVYSGADKRRSRRLRTDQKPKTLLLNEISASPSIPTTISYRPSNGLEHRHILAKKSQPEDYLIRTNAGEVPAAKALSLGRSFDVTVFSTRDWRMGRLPGVKGLTD